MFVNVSVVEAEVVSIVVVEEEGIFSILEPPEGSPPPATIVAEEEDKVEFRNGTHINMMKLYNGPSEQHNTLQSAWSGVIRLRWPVKSSLVTWLINGHINPNKFDLQMSLCVVNVDVVVLVCEISLLLYDPLINRRISINPWSRLATARRTELSAQLKHGRIAGSKISCTAISKFVVKLQIE